MMFSPEAIGSILLPLDTDEILVPGERVLYRSPKHWASIVEPTAQTAAAFVLFTLVVFRTPPALDFLVLLVVMLSLLVALRWVLERGWGWTDYTVIGTCLLVIVTVGLEPESILLIAAIAIIGRFLARLIRWAFYEELFVTDRRIIDTSGFFGSRVASISLSRITDVTLVRSTIGELLDFAELRVETPGQDQAMDRVRFIADAGRFHQAVVTQSTRPPGR